MYAGHLDVGILYGREVTERLVQRLQLLSYYTWTEPLDIVESPWQESKLMIHYTVNGGTHWIESFLEVIIIVFLAQEYKEIIINIFGLSCARGLVNG